MSEESAPVVDLSMECGPNVARLATALAKAQGSISAAKKDSLNPHFGSSYADLASVWDVIRAPLSSNGLAIIQLPSTDTAGVTVVTLMLHSSGEWIRGTLLMPLAQRTPQAVGSAITYGRRYSLAAMVGVAAEEDDDGNATRPAPARRPEPPKAPQPKSKSAEATKPEGAPPQEPSIWEKMEIAFSEYGVDRKGLGPMVRALYPDLPKNSAEARRALTEEHLAAIKRELSAARDAKGLVDAKLNQ